MSEKEPQDPGLVRLFRELDEVSPEYARKHWKEERFSLHGKDVEFYGVAHHPATLEIPEYREKLESAIERSTVVFLEGGPVSLGDSFESFQDMAHDFNVKLTDEDLRLLFDKVTQDNPFADFFKELHSIAAAEGKLIASSDPNRDVYSSLSLEKAGLRSEAIKFVILFSSMGIVMTQAVLHEITTFVRRVRERATDERQSGMSRRAFLEKSVIASAGVGFLSAASIGATINEKFMDADRDENVLGRFLYTLLDYRDCCAADGLDRLSGQMQEQESITAVYGAKHLPGISYYVQHPRERGVKLAAYAPLFGKVADGNLTLYSFRDGVWSPQSE